MQDAAELKAFMGLFLFPVTTIRRDSMNNLMTIEEAADYIRMKPKTVRNWVGLRKIPFIKLGRNVRFDMKVLEKWLQRKSVEEHKIWR